MNYVQNRVLSTDDEEWFLEKLRKLGVDRESIFECMVFCIDHSECSTQVLGLIKDNVVSIAGLYLISDVLFNCNKVDVQFSWSYLPQLESLMPEYLEGFHGDDKALKVVMVWSTWGVFDKKYLKGLQCIIANRPTPDTRLIKVYVKMLRLCDEYFIKKLCKESGQSVQGDRNKQIERITCFMDFVLQSNGINEQWVLIDLSSSGERVDIVLEKFHKAVDQLSSPSLLGHEIESSGRKSLKKLLSKYPSTYICSHS
jgi:hypothetical protein